MRSVQIIFYFLHAIVKFRQLTKKRVCHLLICSDYKNFNRPCNNLEKWLMKRGHNEKKMIWNQIFRVRKHSRNDLLQKEKQRMSEKKVTFNITYYPSFQNVRSLMEELQKLLTTDINCVLLLQSHVKELLKLRKAP